MRGKAAAQAANRRLAEALDRVTSLEQRLAAQEAAHRAEASELRAELQRARGATSRQIKQLAEAQVQAERDRANAAIQEAREKHLSQVVAGLAKVQGMAMNKLAYRPDQWIEVAEGFGVDVGPMLDGIAVANGESTSRDLARTSNKSARWKNRIIDGIEAGELHDPGGAYKSDRWREA